MGKILIAYITKTGSTKEVAEEIGRVLTQNGLNVDILELSKVQKLEGYSGVVLGAPINGFQWLPEAVKFVEDNKEQLKKIPTAYFMLSYLLVVGRKSLKGIMKNTLNKVKTIVEPVSIGLFGGKVASGLPLIVRILFGVKKDAPLDVRDWNAVRDWAGGLLNSFRK